MIRSSGCVLEGRERDAEHMKARFVAWNEEVKRTIPREGLLVFDVKEGWDPLCAALGRRSRMRRFRARTAVTASLSARARRP